MQKVGTSAAAIVFSQNIPASRVDELIHRNEVSLPNYSLRNEFPVLPIDLNIFSSDQFLV